MRLIIISGQTSTGKSTIARQLRERLQVESFLKDEYKELLMDADPSLNPLAWMKFERQTWRALYQAVDGSVQTDTDLIIEGNFSSAQRRKIAPLVAGQTIIEIFCYAKPAVVFKRYVARNKNGERHKGHHDNLWYGLV